MASGRCRHVDVELTNARPRDRRRLLARGAVRRAAPAAALCRPKYSSAPGGHAPPTAELPARPRGAAGGGRRRRSAPPQRPRGRPGARRRRRRERDVASRRAPLRLRRRRRAAPAPGSASRRRRRPSADSARRGAPRPRAQARRAGSRGEHRAPRAAIAARSKLPGARTAAASRCGLAPRNRSARRAACRTFLRAIACRHAPRARPRRTDGRRSAARRASRDPAQLARRGRAPLRSRAARCRRGCSVTRLPLRPLHARRPPRARRRARHRGGQEPLCAGRRAPRARRGGSLGGTPRARRRAARPELLVEGKAALRRRRPSRRVRRRLSSDRSPMALLSTREATPSEPGAGTKRERRRASRQPSFSEPAPRRRGTAAASEPRASARRATCARGERRRSLWTAPAARSDLETILASSTALLQPRRGEGPTCWCRAS